MSGDRYGKAGFSKHGHKGIYFLFTRKDVLKPVGKWRKVNRCDGNQRDSNMSRGKVGRSPAWRGLGGGDVFHSSSIMRGGPSRWGVGIVGRIQRWRRWRWCYL